MIRVVDIECLKNKYFHRVGTQFDNAISVAEKEFLIDAYTKTDIVAMLTEIQKEFEKQCKIPNNYASAYDWNNGVYACYKVIQEKIGQLKENENDSY